MAKLKTTIKIPAGYSYETKQEIAARLVSAIVLNAKSGFDKNGNSFASYSKEYAEFKGSTGVDLTYSGAMLDSVKVLAIGRDYIDIGIDGRTNESKKAEGNILGSYGRTPNPSKARDFLGLPDDAVNQVLSSFEMTQEEINAQNFEDAADKIASSMTEEELFNLKAGL